MNRIKAFLLRIYMLVLPRSARQALHSRICSSWLERLKDAATDDFVRIMLYGMELAFIISPAYRKSIKNFKGICAFKTEDGRVHVSALFNKGRMRVRDIAEPKANVTVVFRDTRALWSLLETQDLLNSLLENSLDVYGNANAMYRFVFVVRELRACLMP